MKLPPQRAFWMTLLLVLIGTLFLFLRITGFSFIHFDDPLHIFHNPLVLQPSLQNLWRFWSGSFFELYIPVTYTFWSAISAISPTPAAFHTFSLCLHLLNTALVFTLLHHLLKIRKDKPNPWGITFGTLLFAWHPIQIEAVAWIACARDLLFTAFSLIAMLIYFHNRYRRKKPSQWLTLSALVSFIFACLSKPTAVIVPVLVLAIEIWFLNKNWKASARRLSPWFAVAIAVSIFTKNIQPAKSVVTELWSRPVIALDAMAFYLRKTLLPFQFLIDYGHTPQVALSQGITYLQAALLAGFLGVLFYYRRKVPVLWMGFLAFCLFIVPVSGIVPFEFQRTSTVADRYAYPAMVGIALLGVEAGTHAVRLRAPFALLAPLLVLYGLTSIHLPVWRNSANLFTHVMKTRPDSSIALVNYGYDLLLRGEFEQAHVFAERALAMDPNSSDNWANIGAVELNLGRLDAAEKSVKRALELNPKNILAYYNYAYIEMKRGRNDAAILHLQTALNHSPNHPDVVKTLREISGNSNPR